MKFSLMSCNSYKLNAGIFKMFQKKAANLKKKKLKVSDL